MSIENYENRRSNLIGKIDCEHGINYSDFLYGLEKGYDVGYNEASLKVKELKAERDELLKLLVKARTQFY